MLTADYRMLNLQKLVHSNSSKAIFIVSNKNCNENLPITIDGLQRRPHLRDNIVCNRIKRIWRKDFVSIARMRGHQAEQKWIMSIEVGKHHIQANAMKKHLGIEMK